MFRKKILVDRCMFGLEVNTTFRLEELKLEYPKNTLCQNWLVFEYGDKPDQTQRQERPLRAHALRIKYNRKLNSCMTRE